MDIQTLVELVSGVGFPIVACGCVWRFTNSICKELLETLNNNNQMLKILTKTYLKEAE